jgi:putative restriction endonuclease
MGAHFSRPTELNKGEWNKLIAFAKDFTDKEPQDNYEDGGDTEFPEGKQYQVKHIVRERNPRLVITAKALFKTKHGRLFCEACKFDFEKKYGSIGNGFIEVHHTIPVSELKRGAKTRIADLALVCSNCHRILHRRRPWLTIPALHKLLKQAS